MSRKYWFVKSLQKGFPWTFSGIHVIIIIKNLYYNDASIAWAPPLFSRQVVPAPCWIDASRGQFRGTGGLGVCVVCDVQVKARACNNFGVGGYPWVVSYSSYALCDVTVVARASVTSRVQWKQRTMHSIIRGSRRRCGLLEHVGQGEGRATQWCVLATTNWRIKWTGLG